MSFKTFCSIFTISNFAFSFADISGKSLEGNVCKLNLLLPLLRIALFSEASKLIFVLSGSALKISTVFLAEIVKASLE